jgi:hypothetical protein
VNRFQQVKEILDNSVGGANAGVAGPHRAFWRNQNRDQLVAFKILGLPIVALGSGSDSNLIKALRGEEPFGQDIGTPGASIRRMPAGLDPVPPDQIAFISAWIDDGCPVGVDAIGALEAQLGGAPWGSAFVIVSDGATPMPARLSLRTTDGSQGDVAIRVTPASVATLQISPASVRVSSTTTEVDVVATTLSTGPNDTTIEVVQGPTVLASVALTAIAKPTRRSVEYPAGRAATSSARERLLAVEGLDAGAALKFDEASAVQTIPKPDELTWWDWAVFLLHTAAEIEHALMAQYLYAAYSLADADFTGAHVPPDAASQTARWRRTITAIAREEMAHLLTEQNLLRFIGGPLNFEREDFPFRSKLYPFPLALEPLTKTSLAKYVAAEMPANPGVPDIDAIVRRATSGTGGMRPNRVGVLFDTLLDIFADEHKIADADLRPQTAATQQAGPNDWFGFGRLIVRAVASRDEAVAALQAIGEQGEGSASAPPGAQPSHFNQFLGIYREFPETEFEQEPDWVPIRSIPTNPTTSPFIDPDPVAERSRITHPTTRLWAQLFNVRYRMLLVDLAHALHLSGPLADDVGDPTPRGHLRDWAFLQMRGEGLSGMRGIARMLTARPAKETAAPEDPVHAGPPFELPYTLAIPDDEHSRWRLHLALLNSSDDLVTRLQSSGETDELINELVSIDAASRTVVQIRLTAT